MLRWYRLYLRQFCMVNVNAVPRVESRKIQPELPKLTLRELVTGTLARRDAAANLLRSREEFYAELKRLSAVSVKASTVTIKQVDYTQAISLIKVLRELTQDALAPFPLGLKERKDIYDQVRDGEPYTFKVRPHHRRAIVAKLRGAGATVE